MNETNIYDRALFDATLARFGLSFDDRTQARLADFCGRMLQKNAVMNLTNLTAPADVAVKHLADSLLLLHAFDPPEGASLLDVGTGAGFPAVPLAIVRPDLRVTAMDATGKKVDFLEEVRAAMGVPAACVHGRAEVLGKDPAFRERFDVVTGRAVASMTVLSELCLPFVRVGGVFAAMKGASAEDEVGEAGEQIARLGGSVERVVRYELDDSGENRRAIVLIRKVEPTPAKYPRAFAKIKAGESQTASR